MKKHAVVILALVAVLYHFGKSEEETFRGSEPVGEALAEPLNSLWLAVPSQGISVHGIQLGMPEAQVRAILGKPATVGAESPLRESFRAASGGWWLNYEGRCDTGNSGALLSHNAPHVHFDERDGRVDYVAGPSLWNDGGPVASEMLPNIIGSPTCVGSDDSCYFYYNSHSLVIRGCNSTEGRLTYYLRAQ